MEQQNNRFKLMFGTIVVNTSVHHNRTETGETPVPLAGCHLSTRLV
jgi:hypothetical protein